MYTLRSILIVSNYFYPEVTPRAFRTTELACEFGRQGIEVTLVLPNKEIYRNNPSWLENVKIIYGDSPVIPDGQTTVVKKAGRALPVWVKKIVLYFWNHEYFAKYDRGVERALMGLSGDFDMLISISYPVAIHRAVMKAFRRNNSLTAKCKVAEFSDPPLKGEYNRKYFPAYRIFMNRLGRFFDRFVVPVENAVPEYLPYKQVEEISVIPQGFDNSGIRTQPYHSHGRPTFAYAGRFYRNTRDPKPLFDHLIASGADFSFTLWLIDREPYFDRLIEDFASRAKGEVIVRDALPREKLIYELSGMDFVVNHNFTYSTATPSKLIDYALAGRPVFSFSSDDFDPAAFDRFMQGDYSGALQLPDPAEYDIRHITAKFIELASC